MKIKILLILTFLPGCFSLLYAQQQKADSLQLIIRTGKTAIEKINALKTLTELYSTKDFDRAISLAGEGIELANKIKDFSAAGTFTNLTGLAFYLKGNYDSAAMYYSTSLGLMEKANDPAGKAAVLNNTGRLYRKLKDYTRAILMYDEAFDIFKKRNDIDGMATIYNESGVVYEYKGDFDEAISRYNKSLAIREQQHDSLGKSYSLSFIGGIYVQQKKYNEATVYLNEALQLRKKLNDPFATVLSMTDLADMYAAKKDLSKALLYYDSSNMMATALKYPQLLSENYLKLSHLSETQGNLAQSLVYYKRYAALKDSLLSDEKVAQIEELNAKYQTDKKEQQLKIQDADIQKKNFLLLAGCVVFLLLAFTGISIYRKRQAQNRFQLQQEVMKQQDLSTKAIIEAEENERRRIAADLHDGVGQIMSAAKMNLSVFENELAFTSEQQKLSFENIISMVDESCKEIRSVSHQMMPNALLKSSLAGAVKEFIDKIDSKIIKITLHAEGLNCPINKNIETVLYRVIQECVNNVLKHAEANHLDIALIKDNDGIAATIEDNGKGFDISDKYKYGGLGLKNIISRINYLKGTIDFDSTAGKGTLIAIHVPVN